MLKPIAAITALISMYIRMRTLQTEGSNRYEYGLFLISYHVKCSEYRKVVTVEGASCSDSANVIQYQYNVSNNDEWILNV